MFKLTVILIALFAAAPVQASDYWNEQIHNAFKEKAQSDRELELDRKASADRADRMAAEAEAASNAAAQRRALDSIEMQLYQMNTR